MSLQPAPQFQPDEALNALTRLNQAAAIINHIGMSETASRESILQLIVRSVITIVPNSSAVVYMYDLSQRDFITSSRVAAGELVPPLANDHPRPNGLGRRAVDQRRRVVSYEETDLDISPSKKAAGAHAAAVLPLIVAKRMVGVLYVYLHEQRRFASLELLLLDNFVNQSAIAIYHARLVDRVKRDLARKEDEANRLRRASVLISSRPRLQETLETILQMAVEVTNADYGSFRLVDPTGRNLTPAAVSGERLNRAALDNLPIESTSVVGWVAQHRQPLCIPDVQVEPWASIYSPLNRELQIRSELAVPLISASGRLEGVLNLESPTPGIFSDEDNLLMQAFATQAVTALQEIKLLNALQEISELLLTEALPRVLDRLAGLACELLNASTSAVWLLENETLVLGAASKGHQHCDRLPLHNSLIGQAILQSRPVISNRLPEEPLFNQPELARAQGWKRALIVPLMVSATQGQAPTPLGAFSVYGTEPDPGLFTESEWDNKILTILARYAALAIQSASRQEAMRNAQDQHTVSETFAALGDVAANLLHQINNKFGSIPVRIEGIQDKCAAVLQSDTYLANNLAEIEKSAREAMSAVRDNLTLLRPIHPSPVNLAVCIQDAIHSSHLPEGVQVKTLQLESLPPVFAGEQSLRLVFTNLFENASAAMQGQGTITISGSAQCNQVEILVSDTGPGISQENQGKIFELNDSGNLSSHLGFGLWWVKTLMARLGGSVSVESDGQNGATFRLLLPSA